MAFSQIPHTNTSVFPVKHRPKHRAVGLLTRTRLPGASVNRRYGHITQIIASATLISTLAQDIHPALHYFPDDGYNMVCIYDKMVLIIHYGRCVSITLILTSITTEIKHKDNFASLQIIFSAFLEVEAASTKSTISLPSAGCDKM